MSTTSKKISKGKPLTLLTNGSTKKSSRANNGNRVLVYSDGLVIKGGSHHRPYKINPESSEEREKRLAKRKALTLRMLRTAYENHQISKVSR